MAMIDGDTVEQTPSEVDSQHADMTAGFQQIGLDDNVTTPTPPKNVSRQLFTRKFAKFLDNFTIDCIDIRAKHTTNTLGVAAQV